jgi:hypothetical protein
MRVAGSRRIGFAQHDDRCRASVPAGIGGALSAAIRSTTWREPYAARHLARRRGPPHGSVPLGDGLLAVDEQMLPQVGEVFDDGPLARVGVLLGDRFDDLLMLADRGVADLW